MRENKPDQPTRADGMAAAQILGPFGANPALLALPYMGGTAWIKQVRAARKWAVAYVTAALPVGVALNDRNSRRRCGIPVHRRA